MKNPLFKKTAINYRGYYPEAKLGLTKDLTSKWKKREFKIAEDDMSCRYDITRETCPLHFAIADAVGGVVNSFKASLDPFIETDQGNLFVIYEEGTGMAVVWNEQTTNESNAFNANNPEEAVEAALSVLPKSPKSKKVIPDSKIFEMPKFTEADKIRLHGLSVKGSFKPVWDKALSVGMLQFSDNRYSFTKSASAILRAGLKEAAVRLNCALSRRHIPKRASAHEAAIKEIAKIVVASNRKLDKVGTLAKRAARATHILYDAGPESYTIRVMRDNDTIDEYNGADYHRDSMIQFNHTDDDAFEYNRMLRFAEQVAKEYAQEYDIPENMIDHDENLMAEDRENSSMEFIPHEENNESHEDSKKANWKDKKWDKNFPHTEFIKKQVEHIGSKKPKCPYCGSTKYGLMPPDFETAKCDKCGRNWNHGIVDGINNPYEKTAVFTPEDADKFQQENSESDLIINEDTQGGILPESSNVLKTGSKIYPVVKEKDGDWYIKGLPSIDINDEVTSDTFIVPGMNYSTHNAIGLVAGIYSSLYDEFQINENLKEGDIFETPVGQFICDGAHVVPYDEKAKASVATVNDVYKCTNCGCDKGDHRLSYDENGKENYYECKNHPDTCKEYKPKGKIAMLSAPDMPPPAVIEQAPDSLVKPAVEFPLQVQVPPMKGDVKPAIHQKREEIPTPYGEVKPALEESLPEGKTHMYVEYGDKNYKEI